MLEVLTNERWTPGAAAHLLNRAAFGGSPADVAALHRLGRDGAVEALLCAGDESDLFPVPVLRHPEDLFEVKRQARTSDDEARKRLQAQMSRQDRDEILLLRAWWLNRMRWSPFAAREKATLFWHGHWATSTEKVREPFAIWQQNETLRAYSLGSLRAMAREISRDPAMMRYLDLQQSQRNKPNENFARELLELFLLGEGRYEEADIREIARAFTGYRIDPRGTRFVFARRQHDEGVKSIFGKTGTFDGDDVIDLVLARPECAQFLARKLWIFYAGTIPDPSLVRMLADGYRASGYDTGALLRRMFRAGEFYDAAVVRRQVKSPVHWLVSMCRILEIPLPTAAACEGILRQLGQSLFAPPNVKGWDGGRAWISSATLLFRYNVAGTIVSGKAGSMPGGRDALEDVSVPLEKIFAGAGSPDELVERAAGRLFQAPVDKALRTQCLAYLSSRGDGEEARRDLLQLMMSTPEFQLT